jgi:hypothetical protein
MALLFAEVEACIINFIKLDVCRPEDASVVVIVFESILLALSNIVLKASN